MLLDFTNLTVYIFSLFTASNKEIFRLTGVSFLLKCAFGFPSFGCNSYPLYIDLYFYTHATAVKMRSFLFKGVKAIRGLLRRLGECNVLHSVLRLKCTNIFNFCKNTCCKFSNCFIIKLVNVVTGKFCTKCTIICV